jgi:hypothetical protein
VKGPNRAKLTFFKNVQTSLIWFSFEEIDNFISIYAGLGQKLSGWGAMNGQSTSIRKNKSPQKKFEIF